MSKTKTKTKSNKVELVIEEHKATNDNNKIYTAVSLFSGMGGDTLGITQAGCRVIAYNELKPTFCKTHEANFPESELICDGKTNDISKLKDECFDKFKGVTDILFAGFPCFIKDTLVLTDNGYKQIQDVVLEDKLLTHTDQFQNIVNLQRKEYTGQLYNIKLKYHPELINCTEEHPFYVREQKKSDLFGEPKWKNASKLTMNDHFGMVINTKEEVPTFNFEGSIRLDHPDQWFIMGYFVGDHLMNDVNELDTNRCWFNIHDDDNSTSDKIKQVLEIKYNGFTKYVKNVSCNNVTWFNIRKQFDGKLIPEWIQNAPKHLIQEFINGYIAVSKSITEQNDDSTIIVTASYNLAYGFQRLYLKLGHIVSIDKIVNQRDTYQICVYTEKQRKQSTFIEGNYVWYAPSKIISNKIQNEPVYNFEVETDNSYIVCNTIVHNCQGFSTAGKKAEDDPRNTLFLEFLRATRLLEPSLIIGENVKGLITKKTTSGELYIDVIVSEFQKLGYDLMYEIVKAENFNVPQSRERLIIVGVKKDNPYGWKPAFPTNHNNTKQNLQSIVKYSMEGAVKVDPVWFAEIPEECIIKNLEDTKVYSDNNNGHPYLLSKINANETARFYAGKQHDYLFSFSKRNSPIHCEIVDIRKPSKTIICTYDHQPRLFVPIQNASGCYLRMFNPDELKQIQGFPSDYIVCGTIKEKIVQIGNAVPPPLIKAIVEKIVR